MAYVPNKIIHPGFIIKEEYLDELGVSTNEAAKKLKVSVSTLFLLFDGKKDIDVDMAKRLEAAGIGVAETWLVYQMKYDLKYSPNPLNVEKIYEGATK